MLNFSQSKKHEANIYYVKGLDPQMLNQHKGSLVALFKGQPLPGSKVEKLNHHSIYSMRISDTKNKGRILFTYHSFSTVRSLLILEILDTHQYHRAKFLKKNVLKRFLEHNQSQLETTTPKEDFTDFKPLDLQNDISRTELELGWIPVHSQNKDYIIFDEVQNTVLSANTPLVIVGDPGSGKTSLALALWKQGVRKNQKSLLVTQSDSLVSNIVNDIENSPEFELSKENNSMVSTYKTVLDKYLQKESLNLQESKLLFKEWFLSIFKSNSHRKYSGLIANQWYLIYQELRTISGYTKEKYTSDEGIGQRQGLFADPKQRETLYYLFEAWTDYLKQNNLVTCEFYEWDLPEREKFDLIVLDEALDFSHAQLRYLLHVARNANIVVCLDPKQNLTDENPKYAYLKNLLFNNTQRLGVSEVQLLTHYRCPENIMNAAIVFDQLRLDLNKKLKKEPKIARSSQTGGVVKWITPDQVGSLQNLRTLNTDVHVCVITHPSLFDEVKSVLDFKAYQIFTPLEAKGMGFRLVILYKILNTDVFFQINDHMEALKKGRTQTDNLYCSAELSACFVACTRANSTLLMIQEKKRSLRHITKLLEKAITSEPGLGFSSEKAQVSTLDEWLEQAQTLARQGQVEKAYKILEDVFGFDEMFQKEGQLAKWGIELPKAYPLEFEPPKLSAGAPLERHSEQNNNPSLVTKKTKKPKKKKKNAHAKKIGSKEASFNQKPSLMPHESQDSLDSITTSEQDKVALDKFLDMLHLFDGSLNFKDFTQKCAEENNTDAQFYLGMRYLKGLEGYPEDPKLGFYWIRRAAELEHPEAIIWIGTCLMQAKGIEQNERLGFHWLLKAADLGLPSAQYEISNCYFLGRGVQVDIPMGIQWCIKAAKGGDAVAQFNIGVSYERGDGVPVDLDAAIYWYNKAADQNYAEALINLSMCYSKGIGVSVDLEKAFELSQKAASSGHLLALHNIAVYYQEGKGVALNEELALSYFIQAAEKGYVYSQFALGKYYAFRIAPPPDVKQACHWFKLAANQNHMESQFNLGYILVEGQGIDKDNPEGMKWLTKAAEQGCVKAQYNLATLYLSRPDIAQDKAKAVDWLIKAAEKGEIRSLNRLGVCYMGEVELNLEKAIHYLTQAVKDDDPSSQYNLAVAYSKNNNDVLAFQWVIKAAKQDLKEAQYSTGMSYANGIGIAKDENLAFEWFFKAAMQEFPAAEYELALCYLRGKGVNSDMSLALKWFETAANHGFSQAQFMAGCLYEEELNDLCMALEWYTKAARQGSIKAQERLSFVLKKMEFEKMRKLSHVAQVVTSSAERAGTTQSSTLPENPPLLFQAYQADTFSSDLSEEPVSLEANEGILEIIGRKVTDNCTIF